MFWRSRMGPAVSGLGLFYIDTCHKIGRSWHDENIPVILQSQKFKLSVYFGRVRNFLIRIDQAKSPSADCRTYLISRKHVICPYYSLTGRIMTGNKFKIFELWPLDRSQKFSGLNHQYQTRQTFSLIFLLELILRVLMGTCYVSLT